MQLKRVVVTGLGALTPIGNVTGVGVFGLSLFQTATSSEARALLGVNTDPLGVTTVTVGVGGDYTTISAALAGITDASSSKRYSLILISDTTETTAITWKDYVFCDLRGFKVVITDTSSAAGITVNTATTNAWFFNGEIFRTTGTLADTVVLRVSSTSGNAVRFVNLRIQNSINVAGCHGIVCEDRKSTRLNSSH